MEEVAANVVLGLHPSHDEVTGMVERIQKALDITGNGRVTRQEAMMALGDLERSDLLQ